VRDRSRLPTTGGAGAATVSSRPRAPQPVEVPLELDTKKRTESRPRPITSSTSGRGNPVMRQQQSRWSLPPLSWVIGAVVIMVVTYFCINWVTGKLLEPSAGEQAAAIARARVAAPVAPKQQATSPPFDIAPDKVEPAPEAPPAVMVRAPSEAHRRSGGKHPAQVPVEKPPHGYGTLAVSCVPWCHIYVDGLDTGRNSPVSGMRLSAGRHELRVVNPPSGRTRDIDVDVESGGNNVQRIEFEKGTAALQRPP
jgi:hypothetical protein